MRTLKMDINLLGFFLFILSSILLTSCEDTTTPTSSNNTDRITFKKASTLAEADMIKYTVIDNWPRVYTYKGPEFTQERYALGLNFEPNVYISDVTGDGYGDLIYWHPEWNGGELKVIICDQSGGFVGYPKYNPGSTGTNTKFYFADVNGDGMNDRISWNYHSEDLKIALAIGGGYFSDSYIYQNGSSKSATKFYFADVNGDGLDDKIFWRYNYSGGDIRIFLATGGGYFTTQPIHINGSSNSATKFYFADVNGDGLADKIFWRYNYSGGDLRVFLALGSGYFSTTAVNNNGSSNSATKFYFADINADGLDDKIYWRYNYSNGDVRVFLATGGGNFAPPPATHSDGSNKSITKFYFDSVWLD